MSEDNNNKILVGSTHLNPFSSSDNTLTLKCTICGDDLEIATVNMDGSFGVSGCSSCLNEARIEGYCDGKIDGYDNGYEVGRDNGYDEGYSSGFDAGRE